MAQSGSVVALGAICRGFESSYPVKYWDVLRLLGEIGKHNRFKICPFLVAGSSPAVSTSIFIVLWLLFFLKLQFGKYFL